ncbi:hypothetical protein MMYC01_203240 [Madurella mycetomatis]|uniref:Small ribosomal subunit protein bS18m n=1 Tax=Madurella mycetomatis TaxID=100816 RepID=A0A175W6W6_9PEZI|nr:hypothetical protein MMYC01_203240 [Madurella mycetomatis]
MLPGGGKGKPSVIRRVAGTRHNPTEALQGLLNDTRRDRGGPLSPEERRQVLEQTRERVSVKDVRANVVTENYIRQMPRRWRSGDVYSPRDLSPREMVKWKQAKAPKKDIIDMLGISPLDNYKNFSFISEFMTVMGRIKHNKETGLRPVNQRKVAKAIRRAIGMGLHPSVHWHPEILRYSRQNTPLVTTPQSTDMSQSKL